MEPIPETERAIDELDPSDTGEDLLDALRTATSHVRDLVPSCRGISLALIDEGVTLTLVASDDEIAVLDAVQYLDGGPCVDSARDDAVVLTGSGDLDERGWQMFAAATAVAGIASTLSLPILDNGAVVGSVNLYASDPHAFEGRHEPIAELLGAWAGGAVSNADLSFSTRETARRAPQILTDAKRVETAVGILMARRGQTAAQARREIEHAAVAAGTSAVEVAEALIISLRSSDDDAV